MSDHEQEPSTGSGPAQWQMAARLVAFVRDLPGVEPARRVANVVFAGALMAALVFAAIPKKQLPERLHARRDKLSDKMRKLSISQTWKMYAPDPSRGHFYMELIAHDEDGTRRVLEESRNVEAGWDTAWSWKRTRRDIWEHTATRRIGQVNRNRTWYLRAVCLREHRRGYDVRRIEMNRVYRAIRPPERVAEGAETLGPLKRKKAQDGSCHVQIIRTMIAEDPLSPGGSNG